VTILDHNATQIFSHRSGKSKVVTVFCNLAHYSIFILFLQVAANPFKTPAIFATPKWVKSPENLQ